MAKIELVNKGSYPDKDFVDIGTEEYRVYEWLLGDGKTAVRRIENPQWLLVTPSGHRVVDGEGMVWFIPATWNSLRWKPKPGGPHFVK